MRIPICLALAAATIAAPAPADWGPTKWGASRDATIAALGKPAYPVTGDKDDQVWGLDLGARDDGTVEGFKVERFFYFDKAGGLGAVRLQPDVADCPALIAKVRATSGKPVEDSSTRASLGKDGTMTGLRTRWTDKAGNQEKFLSVVLLNDQPAPRFCQLLFVPLGTAGPSTDLTMLGGGTSVDANA